MLFSNQTISVALCIANVLFLPGCQSGDNRDHRYVAFDVSPCGQHIVFSSAEGDLFLLEVGTGRVGRLTATSDLETSPAFSPDGAYIVYASVEASGKYSNIYHLLVSDKSILQLTHGGKTFDTSPKYCSDGSRILFARADRYRPYSMGGMTWDDYDVFVMDSDGKNLERITAQKYDSVSSPVCLKEGESVCFGANYENSDREYFAAIYKVPITGSKPPIVLTNNENKKSNHQTLGDQPNVSPDGSEIVFVSDCAKEYSYDLYLMDSDGSNVHPLNVLAVSKYNRAPVFSPDGISILFLAGTGKNAKAQPLFSLWQVDATGKNPKRVADEMLFDHPLEWHNKTK